MTEGEVSGIDEAVRVTPTRIAEIRSLAEKATPGPWIRSGVRHRIGVESCFAVGPDGNPIAFLPIGSQQRDRYYAEAFNDAAFIAACDPQTVLALLSRIEELEGEVERLEKSLLEEIDNRDSREEWINRIYQAVVGDPPEWSNLFGFQEACNAIADAVTTARTEAARKMRETCERVAQYWLLDVGCNAIEAEGVVRRTRNAIAAAISALPLEAESAQPRKAPRDDE